MSIVKTRIESLLNEIRGWLEPFPPDTIELRRSSKLLIQQMQQALSCCNYAETRCYIDRLIDLSKKFEDHRPTNQFELSMIRFECAFAAYKMNDYAEAITILESGLEADHGEVPEYLKAAIKCMLGCIQWQLPNQEDNAIIAWEGSIQIYKELELVNRNSNITRRSHWCSERAREINEVLELALQNSKPMYTSTSKTEFSPVNANITPIPPSETGDTLRLFYVIDQVQAGQPGIVATNPNSLGYIEMERCHINGVSHYIVNLRETGKVIKISNSKDYGVIKISGESMNAISIDDGDYVLLHFQNSAETNDIVAAQINGIDTEATLKKFLKMENRLILRFCSTNPMYKESDDRDKQYEFTKYDNFQIIGVAIAVFKPLNAKD